MKTPVFLAQSSTEMGITCLRMVMAAHGKHVGQEEIRHVCGVSRQGVDVAELISAARYFGFTAESIDAESLLLNKQNSEISLPAIALWPGDHAVVIAGRIGRSWDVIDPLSGRSALTSHELAQELSGPTIIIAPGPDLVRNTRPPGLFRTVVGRHTGSRAGIAFVVLAGLALIVPGILTPGLLRLFVDGYLSTGNRDGAAVIIAGLIIALVLSIALTALQLVGLRRLTTITVTAASARFLWHLLRMPAWFVSQRDPTTLAYRVSLTESIALVMSGPFASAVLAQLTSIFFLIIMFVLSPPLAMVALFGYVILLLMILRIVPRRLEVCQRQAREAAVTMTELGTSLRILETLKATGSENVAFDRIYASIGRRLTLGETHLWGWLGMLPVFTILLIQTMVLASGAWMSIQGALTLGTFAAFSVLLAAFVAPIVVLVPSLDAFFNLRGALEQVNDVLDQGVDQRMHDPYLDPESASVTTEVSPDGIKSDVREEVVREEVVREEVDEIDALLAVAQSGRRKRSGLAIDPWAARLTISNLTFGYTPSEQPLFTDVSITINPGHIVAIVGRSGSGKSSIGRLIAGLYEPWTGDIQIDDKPFIEYSRAVLAREIGFVDQDTVIYQASVRDNLTMFDPDISDRDVITAAKAAQLHDDIIARPGGYDAVLKENGRDLSGGQRQRLGIARALVRQPRLLILDEATSALDARTETAVISQLQSMGCTTLVVAHRLSTVRDADEIIVLESGGIHERGNHSQLAAQNGLYRELMDA
ncbi:MAG: ATP-binding cassette domain-containing protein [Candidatus Nanopelagicales bacterium]|nr:ATP-binding cassette domain-containing protein [Candidatus Nanopelagicales bacterium]